MKIDDEVMAVLSTMTTTGAEARIESPITRALYVKTNKVLEALGGKWNRKAGAHLFRDDAASVLESALLSGEVVTARDIGFFPTPLTVGRQPQ